VAQVKELLRRAGTAPDPRAVLRGGMPVEAGGDEELEAMLEPRRYLGVTDDLVERALRRAADAAVTEGGGDGHGD
jgi:3-carboxy-cis,cis-muconate cycloisomerase